MLKRSVHSEVHGCQVKCYNCLKICNSIDFAEMHKSARWSIASVRSSIFFLTLKDKVMKGVGTLTGRSWHYRQWLWIILNIRMFLFLAVWKKYQSNWSFLEVWEKHMPFFQHPDQQCAAIVGEGALLQMGGGGKLTFSDVRLKGF